MKKIILVSFSLLLMICASVQSSQAQLKRFSIGPFIEAGFPTGDFSNSHQTGYGIGLGADIKLVAGLTAVGSVSFMYFKGKKDVPTGTTTTTYPSAKVIPIRLGLRYSLVGPLYVKVEGGTAQFTGDYNNGVGALVAPGIGVRLLGLDVEGKYEAWFKDGTHGFWGLKAGYNF
ncbi:outer membrane beta-barrel protein [Chitinophaga vietnamensis]|uniref:outer membrane beta-barrel protein n=1 Tax=Chitinophaga vietnamensis TaxID=2593957 RepID=UPI0011787B20|nr:outer membrane beta-barrel protein [Chitinophaga vietnamensis]